MSIESVRKNRGLPFLKRGMRVQLNYSGKSKTGVVTGANESLNINIRFDGSKRSTNCHPRWAISYFDKDGNTIACFPE